MIDVQRLADFFILAKINIPLVIVDKNNLIETLLTQSHLLTNNQSFLTPVLNHQLTVISKDRIFTKKIPKPNSFQ